MIDPFSNEISRAIEKLQARLDALDPMEIARLEQTVTLNASELFQFGEMATRAYIAEAISLEGANAMHLIHENFANESLAARITYIQVIVELRQKAII